MAGIINTSAVLNNGWNSGSNDQVFQGAIAVDPMMEKTYDYVLTSDPVLLQQRHRTQEILYDIFKNSPYFEKYGGYRVNSNGEKMLDKEGNPIVFSKKIERSDIVDIFYYTKEHLEKEQQLNVFELVLQICEFYDLNYDHIVNTVLSIPLKAKLYTEVYEAGHKKIIDETEKLF